MVVAAVWGSSGVGARGQGAADRRWVPEALNFANGLLRDGQYALAAQEYERFLRTTHTGPGAAEAHYGLATAQVFLGKYQEARRQFEEFLRLAPDHPSAATAQFRAGEMAYLVGDLAGARQALETFTARTPQNRHAPEAWLRLGAVYQRQGDLNRARHAFEQALAGTGQGRAANQARTGLARVLAAQGQTDQALQVLEELIRSPDQDQADSARSQMGQVLAAAGRHAEAVEAFAALERSSPRSPLVPEARLGRAEALTQLGQAEAAEALLRPLAADAPRSVAARAAYDLGVSQLGRNQAAEARATFDEALKRFAGTAIVPALLFRSAEAAQKQDQSDEARALFLQLADEYPKDPWADDALLHAAELALKVGDTAAARDLANRFAETYADTSRLPEAHLIAGRAALDGGQTQEAIDLLDRLLTREKPSPEVAQRARYYLGLAYRAAGQKEKAVAILGDLAQTPETPLASDAQFLVGQSLVDAGRYSEAIPPLKTYLQEHPTGDVAAYALAYLAWAHSALQQDEDAAADLETLAREFPKSKSLPPTQLRLAEAALAAKRFARAAELFRPVIAGDNAALKPRAQSGLGWALLQDHQPAEAAAAFASLLESAPQDPLAPEAALARGYALVQAERADEALAAYDFLLEHYPQSDQAPSGALARARLLVRLKRPDDAARAFEGFLRDHPDGGGDASADLVLAEWGWALIDAGRPADADGVFRRLLDQAPESPRAADARFNLAESAFQAHNYEEVERLLRPLVAQDSKADPSLIQSALFRLGRARAERQEWSGAAEAFDRVVTEYPDGPFRREARFWKAEVAFQAGDAHRADTEFAALLNEPAPEGSAEKWIETARLRRVQCLVLLERWEEALSAAEALKADLLPDSPLMAEVQYERGRALQSLPQPRFAEARAAYQTVIASRKGGDLAARAQFMRGETFFHQGDYREALRELLMVDILYEAPRWQAAALLEVGKVYEQLDQWADAAEIYKKLQSRFPDDPHTTEAGPRLEAALQRVRGDDSSPSPAPGTAGL